MANTIQQLIDQQNALIRDETSAGSITKENVANILNNMTYEQLARGIKMVDDESYFGSISGSDYLLLLQQNFGVYYFTSSGVPDPPFSYPALGSGYWVLSPLAFNPNLGYKEIFYQCLPGTGGDDIFQLVNSTMAPVTIEHVDTGIWDFSIDGSFSATLTACVSITTGNTNPAFGVFMTFTMAGKVRVQAFDSGTPSDAIFTRGTFIFRDYQ